MSTGWIGSMWKRMHLLWSDDGAGQTAGRADHPARVRHTSHGNSHLRRLLPLVGRKQLPCFYPAYAEAAKVVCQESLPLPDTLSPFGAAPSEEGAFGIGCRPHPTPHKKPLPAHPLCNAAASLFIPPHTPSGRRAGNPALRRWPPGWRTEWLSPCCSSAWKGSHCSRPPFRKAR